MSARDHIRQSLSAVTPLTGGCILLALIYLIEFYTGVSGSVGYVLTVLLILWFSWSNPYVSWIGVLATLLMVAGFFMIENNTYIAIVINRLLAIVTIWIAVIFVNRYRKLAEDEVVRKHQLQALFENASEGMIFTDSMGKIVRVNPAAEKMFGYNPGELVGKEIEVLVPDKFMRSHVRQRTELFHDPKPRPKGSGRELQARRRDGMEFDTEISLSYFLDRKQVFYIAFIVDISERKKQEKLIEANVANIKKLNFELDGKVKQRTSELETALIKLASTNTDLVREIAERTNIEERLVKSQQLYSAIARNFPEGVIGVLNREMKYVLADGQELKKIGFSSCNPLDQPIFGTENAALTAYAEAMLSGVFQGEPASFDIDLRDQAYNLIAVPLPDGEMHVNEILVVIKNITERKMAERKLVKTIEKEKELGALKSRFVTMASHEFRTPLSTMLSSVFLLQNYTGDKYEAQKKTHLERIKRSIQTLTELMNDFLSIGSLDEGGQIKVSYSRVEINSFLKDLVGELHSIKKPGQQIDFSFAGQDATLMMDRVILTNILRNLVSNAVKYSPDETSIKVSCSLAVDYLIISIEDHGIGIPDQEQPEIFKRFYRAENVTNIQGTGLGLNLVKKYVKLLNGTIAFKSKVNEGTTFTLTLPVRFEEETEMAN
jgi:PAS domain S-box-containing protein